MTLEKSERLIWFRGDLTPASKALVSVLSPTAQFGLNVFEGIRGYWSDSEEELYLFRLNEHLSRLLASCRLIGITCPYSVETIVAGIRDCIRSNGFRCDVALRCTVFVDGEGGWTNSDPVDMFIAPVQKARVTEPAARRACVSNWTRIDDRSMPPRIKAGANYINGRYAHLDAQAGGYDFPILVDRDGHISEGAGACIFLIRDGTLVTPARTCSILESITRATLVELASDMGLSSQERVVDRTELYLAQEVFLCGSAAEITPLGYIDRHVIGDGTAGSVTRALLLRYHAAVSGADMAKRRWLTPVWRES